MSILVSFLAPLFLSLSSRLVVYLSGLLVKGKKIRTTLGIIREMTRRERDGWLYKSIVKKELTLTLYVFFSSRLR